MDKRSKEIEYQLKELKKQKEKLEQERLLSLVDEGKAFKCGKCDTILVEQDASTAEVNSGLCWNCLQRRKKEEQKRDILNKLKLAKIVDIDIEDGWAQIIKRITVAKQGMMYELKAMEDEGDAYFYLDKEWKEDMELIEDEVIKPWQKPRKEKPLIKVK